MEIFLRALFSLTMLFSSFSVASAAPAPVPQTGQTNCWDGAGTLLTSCVGTGQDGEYQFGVPWPSPRFTDNSIGTPADLTLTDNLTGLIWTKDANLMKSRDPSFDTDGTNGDGQVFWQNALDYIKKLNTENLLGHNDWRLPNINELKSLTNQASLASYSIWLKNQGFSNVGTYAYWSGTTLSNGGSSAYGINMSASLMLGYGKTYYTGYMVWPVRSGASGTISLPKTGQTSCWDGAGTLLTSCVGTGQDGEYQFGVPWPSPRFTDNSIGTPADLTLTDNLTGLIWTKMAGGSGLKTWQVVLDYIHSLNTSNYLGHNDWRLPNINELESLPNRGQADNSVWLKSQGFTVVESYYAYLSGTTRARLPGEAWGVAMGGSSITDYLYKTAVDVAWAVRSGYVARNLSVTKSGNGGGAIIPSSGNIMWNGANGIAQINLGDIVTLTATPDIGSTFNGWSGACSGFGTCQVIMDAAKSVTAMFSDTTPPNAPVVSSTLALTSNPMPTWSWSSGGNGGNGTFRYRLDNSDLTTGATETTTLTYTPVANLADGAHTLYLQERDAASNWSANGSFVVTVDTQGPVGVTAGAIQLPKTGQTACYDTLGAVVSCNNAGQDGTIQAGVIWPYPRFVNNGDQTISDNLTGLIWSRDTNPATTGKTWQQALDYIKTLNTANYLGHNDWRLPNVYELESLTNKGLYLPETWLTGQGFLNIEGTTHYWSSSTLAAVSDHAWYVEMKFINVGYDPKSSLNFVWPVRSGSSGTISLPKTGQNTCYDELGTPLQSCSGTGQDGELQTGTVWPSPRFTANGDQTVTDKLTGLIWSKDANPAAQVTVNWQQGTDYIAALNASNYLGHNDWRLPNRTEMASLASKVQPDSSAWLTGQGFSNVQSYGYWTSSSFVTMPSNAWCASIGEGHIFTADKAGSFPGGLWPARGGILSSLAITINAGAAITSSTSVTLSLSATDPSGVAKMKVSNLVDLSDATEEIYAGSKPWTLTDGDGLKTVYVKFKDTLGNWSQVYSTTILLDSTAPVVVPSVPAGSYTTTQTVSLNCSDGVGTGCVSIRYTLDGTDPTASSTVYFSPLTISATTTLKFTASDKAGNNSLVQTALYSIQGITLSTGNIGVVQGETRPSTVTLTSLGGFNQPIALSAAWQGAAPVDTSVQFSPSSVTPTGTTTLSITTGAATSVGAYILSITATGGGLTQTLDINVNVLAPLTITTQTLASGIKGQTYTPTVLASGGSGPYTFSLASASSTLPTGLTSINSNGTFSGTPTARGTFTFTVQAADSDARITTKTYTVRIYDLAYRQLVLEAVSWNMQKWDAIDQSLSDLITVRLIDDYGADAAVATDTSFLITTSSPKGKFSVNWGASFFGSSGTVANTITGALTIFTPFDRTQFHYKDTTAGTFTLTASGQPYTSSAGWSSGSHIITVTDVAPVQHTLTVTRDGVGTGTVVANSGTLIWGGTTWTSSYLSGTSVILTATPDPGFVSIWSGCDSSNGNQCTVAMTAAKAVIATFELPPPIRLNVAKSDAAAGSLTSSPVGISCLEGCGPQAFADFPDQSQVVLTATPATGYYFLNWSNCDSPNGAVCTLNATAGHAIVTANFSAQKITTLSIQPKSQTLAINDPLSISGLLDTPSYGASSDRNGQTITITIVGPNGTVVRTAPTTDTVGNWSLPVNASDVFSAKGTYLIRARFDGAQRLMASQSETATILVAKSAGYAIIIQGKIDSNEGLDDHRHTTDTIVNHLKSRNFRDADIAYLTSSTAKAPSKAEIRTAILDAKDKINFSPAPLYIIMVDHGSNDTSDPQSDNRGRFHLGSDGFGPVNVTPSDLDGWLTELENGLNNAAKLANEKRIVIIGTCYSGSFINKVGKKAGRVVITSAGDDEESIRGQKIPTATPNVFVRSGEYFLEEFFNNMSRGRTVKDSFEDARERLKLKDVRRYATQGQHSGVVDDLKQHPLMDDDGDGIGVYSFGKTLDGQQMASFHLGEGEILTNAADNPGDITATTPTLFLESIDSSETLWLTASNNGRVDRSWIEIRKPGAVSTTGSGTGGQVIIELESVNLVLNATTGKWGTAYSGFTEPGMYEIFYYTHDNQTGYVSPMAHSVVYKKRDANSTPASPPAAFVLKFPSNGSTETTQPVFMWQPANDSDPVSYTLMISSTSDFSVGNTRQVENIRDTFYAMPLNVLSDLKTYWWKVRAIDSFGATTDSPAWNFYTSNTNADTVIVYGVVRDALTMLPLNDAGVTLGNLVDVAPFGSYFLRLPAKGNYSLTGSYPGYVDATVPVNILSQSSITRWEQDIFLTPGTPQTLTINIAGNGTVTTNGNSSCISSGLSNSCTPSFPYGTVVTMLATDTPTYAFANWSVDCSGTDKSVCQVTMKAPHTVSATFNLAPNFKNGANGVTTLAGAIDSATAGDEIRMLATELTIDVLTLSKALTLSGGWDAIYSSPTVVPTTLTGILTIDADALIKNTVVNGKLFVKSGKLKVDGVKVR